MTDATRHLLEEALKLSPTEREELLSRLEEGLDEDIDPEWTTEIERRAASDPTNDRPWPEVLARLDAKHNFK
jgi:hypothetical protein